MIGTNLDLYETEHMALAAYLILCGMKVKIEVRPGNRRRATFVFSNVPRHLVIEFNESKAKVDPQAFALKLTDLHHEYKRKVAEYK